MSEPNVIPDGETVAITGELIAEQSRGENVTATHRILVKENPVSFGYDKQYASNNIAYPPGMVVTVKREIGQELYAHAPNGRVELEMPDETVSVVSAYQTPNVTEESTDSTGAGNAASLYIADSETVAVDVDVSGACTLTVEVSNTGWFNGEESEWESVDYGGATEEIRNYPDIPYRYIRAYVDANITEVKLVKKGGV